MCDDETTKPVSLSLIAAVLGGRRSLTGLREGAALLLSNMAAPPKTKTAGPPWVVKPCDHVVLCVVLCLLLVLLVLLFLSSH